MDCSFEDPVCQTQSGNNQEEHIPNLKKYSGITVEGNGIITDTVS